MPSAPIFLDHPSTKTGVSLEGKNCTAGIDTTEPWPCHAMSVKSCIEVHWLHLVSGQGSSSASKTCPILVWACAWECVTCVWGAKKKIAGCSRSGQRCVNRFRSDRRFHRFELTKFESIRLREQQSQPRLLGSIVFHRIPWVCAVMECIQWVAWRTSSVWTFVSLSWCLYAFGQSKSSDAMPWAKVSTEFDSPFQGEHSFETSSSSYTKKVSVPRRSCGGIEPSLMGRPAPYPNKPFWNPLSLSMEGGEMNGNEMNCMMVLVFCIFKPSLPSPPTSHKTGAKWPAFLGLHAWSDNIGGWILSSERAESFAAYALVKKHQDTLSALMSLIKSYTGSFRRCSTQKTVCTLPCKEMQVQFQRLAGHGQWSWQQRLGAWVFSFELK